MPPVSFIELRCVSSRESRLIVMQTPLGISFIYYRHILEMNILRLPAEEACFSRQLHILQGDIVDWQLR